MNSIESLQKAWEDYLANCQIAIDKLRVYPSGEFLPGPVPFASTWQELGKSFGLSAEFIGGASKTQDTLSKFLPGLGLTREYQQIAKRLMELAIRFQNQCGELLKLGAEIQQRAQRSVNASFTTAPHRANDPAALYDAWIDGAESAYAQIAHSDAFALSIGELCNTLSRFKVERGKLQEAFARSLDLPSRAEIDSLHRQIRELTLALRAGPPRSSRASRPTSKKRKPPKP